MRASLSYKPLSYFFMLCHVNEQAEQAKLLWNDPTVQKFEKLLGSHSLRCVYELITVIGSSQNPFITLEFKSNNVIIVLRMHKFQYIWQNLILMKDMKTLIYFLIYM